MRSWRQPDGSLPGDLVQKAVLLLVFLRRRVRASAGWSRATATVARAAAIILFLWNPWVLERLADRAVGRRGRLRPAAVDGARGRAGARRRTGSGWPALVFWLGLAAVFSPASGLVALAVALCVLVVRPRVSRLAAALGAGLVVNLPWILPALVTAPAPGGPGGPVRCLRRPGRVGAGRGGQRAVARRHLEVERRARGAHRGAGRRPVAPAHPACRAPDCGWQRAPTALASRPRGRCPVAVALALLTAVPAVGAGLDDLSRGQCPRSASCATPTATSDRSPWSWRWGLPRRSTGCGSERCRDARRCGPWRAARRAAPLLALPSLAWGLGGQWRPVSYPAEWYTVRELRAGRSDGGAAVGRRLPRLRLERPARRTRPGTRGSSPGTC